MEQLDCPEAFVHFRLAGVTGVVHLRGVNGVVAGDTDLSPFGRLRLLQGLGGLTMFAAACGAFAAYTLRNPWYADFGAGIPVVGAAAFTALSALVAWTQLLRPDAARTKPLLVSSILAATLGLAGAAFAWHSRQPTMDVARSALERGDDQRAAAEATALLDLGFGDEEPKAVLDEIHQRRVTAALSSIKDAVAEAELPWLSEAAHGRATARVSAAAAAACAREGATPSTLREVASAVKLLASEIAGPCSERAAMLEATACMERVDLDCVAHDLAELNDDDAASIKADASRSATAQFQGCLKGRYTAKLDERSAALSRCAHMSDLATAFSGKPTSPSAAVIGKELAATAEGIAQAQRAEADRAAAVEKRAHDRLMREAASDSAPSRSRLPPGSYSEHVGERGGVYHYSASGKKVYSKHR